MSRLTSWLELNAGRLTPLAKTLGPQHREGAVRRWITFSSLAVAGSCFAWWRLPAPTRSLLWAEDGNVFVADAMKDGGVSVFAPWAGYMHIVPRSVASAVTGVVPLEHVPAAITLAACIMLGAIAAYLVDALRGHIPHLGLRLLPWAALVASPLAGIEVNGSIANTHWYLLVAALAASLAPWESWPDTLLASAALVLAIGSDPLALYVAPIVVVRAVGIRKRTTLVPACTAVAAAIVQLAVVASTELAPHDAVGGVGPMVRAYLYRVVIGGSMGTTKAAAAYPHHSALMLAAAAVLLAAMLAVAILLRSKGAVAVIAMGASIALFVASTFLRWRPILDPDVSPYWPGSRYSVAPIALLAIAVAVLLEGGVNRRRWRLPTAIVFGCLALVIGSATYSDLHVTARTGGASWDAGLEMAQVACAASPTPEIVEIPTAPTDWAIALPCDRLTAHG